MQSSNAKERQGWDWAGLAWLFLFFWYFSGVTQVLIQLTGTNGFTSFRQAFLVSGLWLIPVLLFPSKTKSIAGGIGIVLWLTSLIGLGYFCIYGQQFSQSVIFIMFESNMAESTEYFGQYFVWWMVPVYLIYTLGAWLIWRKVRPLHSGKSQSYALAVILVLSLIGYPAVREYQKSGPTQAAIDKFEGRFEPAVPWQLVVGYNKYRKQLENMNTLLEGNAKLAPLTNMVEARADQPSTLVLVIGESTNRQRMSLYGYNRETTPELDKLRDQLQVFDNVVTPRPYTIEALQQVLTFADENNPDGYLSTPSIINMMEQAGYKTFWITNQQTMTKRNTMLTTFSKQTDEQVYLNNNLNQNARQYDGDVLKPFNKALADKAPRKLIVVHLLGTHMRYKYRYPEEFEKFTDNSGVPKWVTEDQMPTYNSYDNAVLYNDFVVSSLIKQFSASQPDGFLLYLSDHGEAVFDSADGGVIGRNEGKPTAPMYTIPFIVWASDKWKQHSSFDFKSMLSRPYSSANLIHTWADLAGLSFAELDKSKSLISDQFTVRPQIIGDPSQPKSLIDFSMIKTRKNHPAPDEQVSNQPLIKSGT
ncbi:phosphoethanolamine transferase EptC [Pseudomonas marincola]|uniref:Sulfatase N-terminal domain-containing protein n=1 Tax=Pseudomonas marincola TaxID=437900 RepID=A0A653E267_9PSED|nr:phosphoethanolamine transferase CptA [Pseudomonas marincola]CAE6949644.1 phosphoethanolamine transferase EptC [Pseudomonas marincola]